MELYGRVRRAVLVEGKGRGKRRGSSAFRATWCARCCSTRHPPDTSAPSRCGGRSWDRGWMNARSGGYSQVRSLASAWAAAWRHHSGHQPLDRADGRSSQRAAQDSPGHGSCRTQSNPRFKWATCDLRGFPQQYVRSIPATLHLAESCSRLQEGLS